jgi:hypothetical protein
MCLCSHWKDFVDFVTRNVGADIAKGLDLPDHEVPNMIATWIFMKCDIPDAGRQKRMSCQGLTFSTALRMRASISFHYNQIGRAGNWSQMVDGSWSVNPSVSSYVSRYMLSLQRRKVLPHSSWHAQSISTHDALPVAPAIYMTLTLIGESRRDCSKCSLHDFFLVEEAL